MQHSQEKLREVQDIQLSYASVKTALQTAGLAKRRKKPGSHPRAPAAESITGLMPHIGSDHR